MNKRIFGVSATAAVLVATLQLGVRGDSAALSASATIAGRQPFAGPDIRSLLDGAAHFSEFVNVPAGGTQVPAYVSYPDRADKAPVVLVSSQPAGMTDWLRGVGVRLSREGFIAIVADTGSVAADDAVRGYAARIPAANGTVATLALSSADGRIAAGVAARRRSASFDEQGWLDTVAFLRTASGNRYVAPAVDIHARMVHAEHLLASAQASGAAGRPAQTSAADGDAASPMDRKRADLPPHLNLAGRTLATSPRKGAWVDIPMGAAKLHTWIVYPAGDGPAPIVVVVHGAGYGFNDWTRSVSDQLAQEGFIALTPDLLSGFGPNGGNSDSFPYPDDVTRAMGRLGATTGLERVKAVRNYGMKLPRANGKSATLGFCFGGGQAFLMAAEPGVNAGVVFYGAPPPAEVMSKVMAPVIGFYGEDDARLTATVEPTAAAMTKLGKLYEPHIYRHATHAFLQFQDLANNFQATADAWPRAIAFLKQHVK